MVTYLSMSEQEEQHFLLLNRTPIYQNPWISVREDAIRWASGRDAKFGVVEMLPGSSILAVDRDLNAYLVREFKYAVQRECIEVVSGGFRGNESPREAAERELAEELGITALEWTDLGVVDPFTNVIKSPNYMFMARELAFANATPDDDENIRVIRLPLREALEMVWRSEITHAASCVVLLKAAAMLGIVHGD